MPDCKPEPGDQVPAVRGHIQVEEEGGFLCRVKLDFNSLIFFHFHGSWVEERLQNGETVGQRSLFDVKEGGLGTKKGVHTRAGGRENTGSPPPEGKKGGGGCLDKSKPKHTRTHGFFLFPLPKSHPRCSRRTLTTDRHSGRAPSSDSPAPLPPPPPSESNASSRRGTARGERGGGVRTWGGGGGGGAEEDARGATPTLLRGPPAAGAARLTTLSSSASRQASRATGRRPRPGRRLRRGRARDQGRAVGRRRHSAARRSAGGRTRTAARRRPGGAGGAG